MVAAAVVAHRISEVAEVAVVVRRISAVAAAVAGHRTSRRRRSVQHRM
jgi:hypothetical protein